MSVPLYIPVVMTGLLALSGFFSASETALFSLQPIEIEKRTKGLGGDALRWCVAHARSVLLTILLSNLAINTLYFALAGYWAAHAYGTEAVVVPLAALLMLVVFAEVAPKSIAMGMAGSLASWSAPVLRIWSTLVAPLRWPSARILGLLAHRFRHTPVLSSELDAEEVHEIVRRNPGQFGLRHRAATLVGEIVTLTQLQVREFMLPLVDIDKLDAAASVVTARAEFLAAGTEWLPVERDGDIIGHVDARELLSASDDTLVGDLVRPFRVIPELGRLQNLLEAFGSEVMLNGPKAVRPTRILVVDEYGHPVGVVSWDDLAEDMIGDLVRSESGGEGDPVRPNDDGSWRVSGSLGVREFMDLFGVKLPLRRNRTIGGWVVDHLERLPAPGDQVELGRARFTVVEVERARIRALDVSFVFGSATSRSAS